MTKLSDTQLVILAAASQRQDGNVLPLPGSLYGGARGKVITSLMTKGLIEEVEARAGDEVWRETGDGHGVTLAITRAGLTAINCEPEDATQGAQEEQSTEPAVDDAGQDKEAPVEPAEALSGHPKAQANEASWENLPDHGTKSGAARKNADPDTKRKQRAGTKQAQLIEMLRTPDGASIAEISNTFGWQQHTVRGAIAGGLKKKLGLEVASEKVEGRGTVYRIPA